MIDLFKDPNFSLGVPINPETTEPCPFYTNEEDQESGMFCNDDSLERVDKYVNNFSDSVVKHDDSKERDVIEAQYGLVNECYGMFSVRNTSSKFKSLNLHTLKDEKTGETVIYDYFFNRYILESPKPKIWTVGLYRLYSDDNVHINMESLNQRYKYHEGKITRLARRIVLPRIFTEGFIKCTSVVAYCVQCCGMVFPVDPDRIYVPNPYGVYPAYQEPKDKTVRTMHGRGLTFVVREIGSMYVDDETDETFSVYCYDTEMVTTADKYMAWYNKYGKN